MAEKHFDQADTCLVRQAFMRGLQGALKRVLGDSYHVWYDPREDESLLTLSSKTTSNQIDILVDVDRDGVFHNTITFSKESFFGNYTDEEGTSFDVESFSLQGNPQGRSFQKTALLCAEKLRQNLAI